MNNPLASPPRSWVPKPVVKPQRKMFEIIEPLDNPCSDKVRTWVRDF